MSRLAFLAFIFSVAGALILIDKHWGEDTAGRAALVLAGATAVVGLILELREGQR